MAEQASIDILNQLRVYIIGRLEAAGEPVLAARFSQAFSRGNFANAMTLFTTTEQECWLEKVEAWDVFWPDVQEDVWAALYRAGFTSTHAVQIMTDTDDRVRAMFKAMLRAAGMALLRVRAGAG